MVSTGADDRFGIDLTELWAYRELLYFFVWRDIKVRYKQTIVGIGWAIIQPLMTMVLLTIVFGRLAGISTDGLPHAVFYYTALVPWTYFAGALQHATSTMVDNQRVVTKVYFPRLILPLSAVFSGMVDFGIAFIVLIGIAIGYGVYPSPTVLLLPLFLLLAVASALAVGLWLSTLNALYRDVRYVLPFLIQFWMLASPVAYPTTLVPGEWRWLYGINPMVGVIEGFRWAIAGRTEPPGAVVLVSASAVVLLLMGGLVFFRRMEGHVADVI